MNSSPITGMTSYRGIPAQQHQGAFEAFAVFLAATRPARVLEIGTAGGGFILWVRDVLDALELTSVPVKSFDIVEQQWYKQIRQWNVEIRIENIFDETYSHLALPERVVPFIQGPGTTVVLCDGGNKIAEFGIFAPYLKVGDFIMAHDYVDTADNFQANYVGKIWDWCEIDEASIAEASAANHLEHCAPDLFDPVVWVCKRKMRA